MNGQLDLSLRGHRSGLITVSDLVRMVRDTVEINLPECWVVGEVSNARLAPSNHFYFTLKDERSAINVVMFKSAFNRMRFKVTDGMEVIVRGRVNVFEQRGALQLYAEEMEPRGAGALQVAFEQLKKRLEAEGLFDRARKRAIPFLPQTIGIVTARGGAGLRDMLRILFDRFPNVRVIFRPAKVQGDGAAEEIGRAIADLNRDGRAEVLIVGRGGGSLEDLWAFNEEVVARAIFRSSIAVISAVGHEIDYTIADFVADMRAPTPTAAAHMVVPSMAELKERVASNAAALVNAMERELAGMRETVDDLGERIRHPASVIADARERVESTRAELGAAIESRIDACRSNIRELRFRLRSPAVMARNDAAPHRQTRGYTLLKVERPALEKRRRQVGALAGRLDALSPLKVLDRGYAVVTNSRDSRAVLDAASVNVGEELDIRLAKGRLTARATGRTA